MDESHIKRLDDLASQRKFAWALGLSGLIPFLACVILVLAFGMDNPLAAPVVEVFRYYSVAILSFLGGIRWGHALLRVSDEETSPERWVLAFSTIPSLIAWVSLLLEPLPAIAILLLTFCTQGAWDSLSANADKLPKWFAPLRMALTLTVAAAHIIILLMLMRAA